MKISEEKLFEIINKEIEFAKKVNLQMSLGMLQIKAILENHFKEGENNE
jgi:hypothetical protein